MDYDDIINHPRFVSTKHPELPMEKYAAQFSPFQALKGDDGMTDLFSLERAMNEKVEFDDFFDVVM